MDEKEYTVRLKRRNIDLRTYTVHELNALRTQISHEISNIGRQFEEYERGDGPKRKDSWYTKASAAMKQYGESLEKVHRHLQGRANNEAEYAYIGILNEFEEKIRQALTDVVPDNKIDLVLERIYE